MNIPLNGRIAIVDDKIDQALPLMRILAKNQIPYVYYGGPDVAYLPEPNSQQNDIRLLFLDINLIDDSATPDEKTLRGVLITVLKRIISTENFPYSLIYWSRHQDEHDALVKGIFENELSDRKPINFKPFIKSDFFPNFSTEEVTNEKDILEEIKKLINEQPAYSYLLNWENKIHDASDKTLQEVFSSYPSFSSWDDNANFLINKLGISFSGNNSFKNYNPEDKIKSSFHAFNYVFSDSLEYLVNNQPITDAINLEFKIENVNVDSIFTINKKLLFSSDSLPIEYSGAVVEDFSKISDPVFHDLLNNTFSRSYVKELITKQEEGTGKSEEDIKKLVVKEAKKIRGEIRGKYKKLYFVVTPLCDYVQNKFYNVRIVKGMLVPIDYLNYIDNKSEAVFTSPKFKYGEFNYAIVLNFRYFFTHLTKLKIKDINPLFRVRQHLLAEVQSKLARHINRQGVLFLEEK